MNSLSWLAVAIVGMIAGWLATLTMPLPGIRKERQGLFLDWVAGVIGALIGGFLFDAINRAPQPHPFNSWILFVAFVAAVVLLGLLRLFMFPKTGT